MAELKINIPDDGTIKSQDKIKPTSGVVLATNVYAVDGRETVAEVSFNGNFRCRPNGRESFADELAELVEKFRHSF